MAAQLWSFMNRHFVGLGTHREVDEFKRCRKQNNLAGENEEILKLLM